MRDLRKYANQTTTRLITGGITLVVIVAVGFTWIFYGRSAALTALLCIGAGLLPVVLIFGLFLLINWILRKNNE
ncbi:hypothetical protein EG832_20525 [bacterium]|nr:hypothetical protein [bacterium]